jgi:hypothetical protein
LFLSSSSRKKVKGDRDGLRTSVNDANGCKERGLKSVVSVSQSVSQSLYLVYTHQVKGGQLNTPDRKKEKKPIVTKVSWSKDYAWLCNTGLEGARQSTLYNVHKVRIKKQIFVFVVHGKKETNKKCEE